MKMKYFMFIKTELPEILNTKFTLVQQTKIINILMN
jgi:hypothetical protein